MRKVPKPQNIGHGWPAPLRQMAKELMENRSGKFRSDQMLDWFLEDVLKGFGVQINEIPPKEVHEKLFRLGALYGELMSTIGRHEWNDYLGMLYMAAGTSNSHLGQFTPYQVSKTIGVMAGGTWDIINTQVVRVLEPCCGSGGMVLAAMESIVEQQGTAALENLSVTCVDLDRTCTLMAAVQILSNMFVRGISLAELHIVWGNSLLPQERWTTLLHAIHQRFGETLPAQDVAVHVPVTPHAHPHRKAPAQIPAIPEKLMLFD